MKINVFKTTLSSMILGGILLFLPPAHAAESLRSQN